VNQNNLDKWRSLLSELEVFDFDATNPMVTMSEENVLWVEKQSGITLPQGYKEYCQVFGSGTFGGTELRIQIPMDDPCDERENINLLRNYPVKEFYEIEHGNLPAEIDNLFNHGYQFGGTTMFYGFLFFDLRTYSCQDLSCDIYAFLERESIYIYHFGRDFFAFIRDICINDQSQDQFPKLVSRPEELDENDRKDYEDLMNFPSSTVRPRTFHCGA
jgi:SMI1 / KNR4 family (SUKH-1)